MWRLLELSLTFAKLCVFAFGGGYVIIPGLISISELNHWATASELTEVVAIAGMAPGPVAVNAAVGFGYKVGGFPGALAALSGVILPCAFIVITTAAYFSKINKHPLVQSALYGLRPVITGIILYASINIAVKNGIICSAPGELIKSGINVFAGSLHLFEIKSAFITVITFLLLAKTKVHPAFIIFGAGILGIAAFR